ncbi:MAG: PKD domain-containing protein [Anaerolineae bacterium]|nr:PKD domain-containing protein [Anaerolineae bacterium]
MKLEQQTALQRICAALTILALLFGGLSAIATAAPLDPQPDAGPPWYVRGEFNSWGTWLMYDDGSNGDVTPGDGIYTLATTIATAGRYEWKVADDIWETSYPPNNAWIVTTLENQVVTFTFDSNGYADGWSPSSNIVNAVDGTTTWTAVGDWQGWDNGNPDTAMVDIGGGLYAHTTVIPAAGLHQYKVTYTGTWDAVGPEGGSGGRSINTDNLDFTTTTDDQAVRFLLNTLTGRIQVQFPTSTVLINETDSDTAGAEVDEFVELYDGGVGGTSLDGLVVVLFNGADDASYLPAVDLDGYATDADGYFVIGGTGVAEADITIGTNYWLQNGADAVTLFAGDDVEFPNDTPVTTTNLIDAVVYDTNDADDPGLLALLNAGQPQVDEGTYPISEGQSIQRCPDGSGGARNTYTYVQGPPSPGTANCLPMLIVSKVDGRDPVTAGELLTYTITVDNQTPFTATNVVITDRVPLSTTFAWAADGGALVGDEIVWTTGLSATPGSPISVTFAVTVDAGISGMGVITNLLYLAACAEAPGPFAGGPVTTTVLGGCVAPIADFISDSPVALGNPMHFTATVGGSPPFTYTWDFGDGMTDTVANPTHLYGAAGIYTVTLTAGNACGIDAISHEVEVYEIPPVSINEIRIDQPGDDLDEYFELTGPDGAALDTLTYLVIGDGTGGSGVIEAVVDLAGAAIPADSYFLVAEDMDTFGAGADMTATLNFENGDNVTHLLVDSFSGALGDDLDLDDDGVLDVIPWNSVLDCVALLETIGSGDLVYCATTVGPDGSFVPSHVFWCPQNSWNIGNYDPNDGGDTPGDANPCYADAAIAKHGPLSVAPGERITYTLDVSMTTIFSGTGVVITDALPADVTFYTFTSSMPVTWSGSIDPLVFQAGTLYGFQAEFIDIVVDVSPSAIPGDELVNTAMIACAEDTIPDNNWSVLTSTVVGMDVSVAKSGPPDPLYPGDTISYTVDYSFVGTDPAANVVITDIFPADFSYSSHSAPVDLTCTPGAGDLVCTAATLAQSGQIIITGTIPFTPTGYVLTNTVWITATNDETPGNNDDAYVNRLVMPIYEIQYVPDPVNDDHSPYEGQFAWIEGIVTAASDVFPTVNTRYFIEETAGGPWSGIYVYNGGDKPPVAEGDHVRLFGQVEEYQGVTELSIRDSVGGIQQVLSSGNPLPAPEVLATGVYTPTGAATAEAYESVLIEFQLATVISDDLGFGEWSFDDGSGETHADDWSQYLTYAPAIGDLYSYIRGIGNYSYSEYKLVPRYDADIDLDYPLTLVYHDAEDVVHSSEAVYVAGDFNGWDPLATPLTPNGDYSAFDVIVTVDVTGTYEYKYVVYTDTVPSGPENWNWLQTNNHAIDVTGSNDEAHDYRFVEPGYVVLQWPHATTTTVDMPTESIYGQIWADDLTIRSGEPRAVLAQVGYGSDPDPDNWTTWETMAWDSQQGNNDQFAGVMTPTATGVYSYVVGFNANWGAGNPNDMWVYGDTDGVHPGDPFEIANAGVLTVLAPPCEPITGADFIWLPLTPTVGSSVTFTATAMGGTPPITYTWDLGDGLTDTGQMVTHVYTASGTYTVTMTAENPCSEANAFYLVTVVEPPPPVYTIFLPVVSREFATP